MSAACRLLITAFLIALTALLPSAAQAADIGAVGSQLRLTRVGPDGNGAVDANNPAIAYNSRDDEFLIAWVGRLTPTAEDEILGQILDGRGLPKGDVQALSSVPTALEPAQPVLGYSPDVNQYLLAYTGPVPGFDDPVPPENAPPGQREIIAQVVTLTGSLSGEPFRLSDTDPDPSPQTPDADTARDARRRLRLRSRSVSIRLGGGSRHKQRFRGALAQGLFRAGESGRDPRNSHLGHDGWKRCRTLDRLPPDTGSLRYRLDGHDSGERDRDLRRDPDRRNRRNCVRPGRHLKRGGCRRRKCAGCRSQHEPRRIPHLVPQERCDGRRSRSIRPARFHRWRSTAERHGSAHLGYGRRQHTCLRSDPCVSHDRHVSLCPRSLLGDLGG